MENFSHERLSSREDLMSRIYALRSKVATTRLYVVDDEIIAFDKALKARMVARFGSTKLLQEVPVWQALVGGSVEASPTIEPELKEEIETEIKEFVDDLIERYELS